MSQVSTLEEATILVTDARFPYNPHRAERWKALGAQVAVARTWGDCYGYVQVATGRAELMVDDRLSPWDAASLIPIIREAGGVYTDWRGGHEVDGHVADREGAAHIAAGLLVVGELLGGDPLVSADELGLGGRRVVP